MRGRTQIRSRDHKLLSEEALGQLREVYRKDKRPWIVCYSGGKDSTAVLQLVYYMLKDLSPQERYKAVHVVCNDTLVEAPPIVEHMSKTLEAVQWAAQRDGLPIVTQKTVPELKNRFFVKIIGRGYPPPTRRFRWCTDKMKILPTSAYIKEQISQAGEVVVVLGTRMSESPQRAKSIQHHIRIHGNGLLRSHASLRGAFIYSPIQDWELEDVWNYLLEVPPPWESSNRELRLLYERAAGFKECPTVIDKATEPCGNSRFGCWVCTVVRQDKSMEGMIESGEVWLKPMVEFRDWLKHIRENHPELREPRLRNGKEAPGPFTLRAREMIFRRLIGVEVAVGMSLISEEEKREIQRLWESDGYKGPSIWEIESEERASIGGESQRAQKGITLARNS